MVALREHNHGANRGWRDIAEAREEADHYNHRAMEEAFMGEAFDGASRDWTIIDVPPGTKRVTMDGVGGASQEVSWQRYNGVRRSKFLTEGDEYAFDRGRNPESGRLARRYVGMKDKSDDELWTEITKDLVVREAIERKGYEFEETEYCYYVFAYLRYVSENTFVSAYTIFLSHFVWLKMQSSHGH